MKFSYIKKAVCVLMCMIMILPLCISTEARRNLLNNYWSPVTDQMPKEYTSTDGLYTLKITGTLHEGEEQYLELYLNKDITTSMFVFATNMVKPSYVEWVPDGYREYYDYSDSYYFVVNFNKPTVVKKGLVVKYRFTPIIIDTDKYYYIDATKADGSFDGAESFPIIWFECVHNVTQFYYDYVYNQSFTEEYPEYAALVKKIDFDKQHIKTCSGCERVIVENHNWEFQYVGELDNKK